MLLDSSFQVILNFVFLLGEQLSAQKHDNLSLTHAQYGSNDTLLERLSTFQALTRLIKLPRNFARLKIIELHSETMVAQNSTNSSYVPNASVMHCFHLPDPEFQKAHLRFNTNLTTGVINAVFSPLAVVMNFLVAFVVFRHAALRQPSNLLLGYLAVSDLLVGLIVQPNYVLFRLLENNHQSVPCFLMMLYSMSFYICYGISFTTLSAISYERFIAVKLQVRYNEAVSAFRVHKFALGIWFLNIALNSLQWAHINTIVRGVHLTAWLICLLAAGFFYCRIRQIVSSHNRAIRDVQRTSSFRSSTRKYKMQVKLTVNIAFIVVFYYIFNLPVLCVTMYHQIVLGDIASYDYYSWAETLALLSSSINPLVCCWRNGPVRRAIVQLFKDGTASHVTPHSDIVPAVSSLRRHVVRAGPFTIGDYVAELRELPQNLVTVSPC